ncbi:MAG: OmpH family outer membrane protein [Pseudomonadota bacterium]|nr:OmpH family outer membrane protein [Pseudomonadota bacterium]
MHSISKKNKYLIKIGFILLFISSASLAEEYKIGVVNVQSILASIPQTEAATKKLEKEFGPRDRSIAKDNKALEKLAEKLKKDGAIMSESERTKIERDIQTRQRDLKRRAQEFQEDLNFRRNEEMQEIQKKIADVVRAYAKENKFDMVLVNGAVYFSERVDLTKTIVERMSKSAN